MPIMTATSIANAYQTTIDDFIRRMSESSPVDLWGTSPPPPPPLEEHWSSRPIPAYVEVIQPRRRRAMMRDVIKDYPEWSVGYRYKPFPFRIWTIHNMPGQPQFRTLRNLRDFLDQVVHKITTQEGNTLNAY